MPTTRKVVDVMIVDDSEDNRNLYARFLTHVGFSAATAATGLEAIQLAPELMPKVIVMDLSMPGMDGWRATQWLKRNKRTRRIPVVALTGHAFAGNEAKARAVGCDECLTKPCLPQELLDRLRPYLRVASSRPKKRSA